MTRVKPVYFSGSISGGREDIALYEQLVEALRSRGVEVLSGEVANREITRAGSDLTPNEVFERDLGWLSGTADRGGAVVAEVSRPSLGVGYEIAAARYLFDMPVICLWRPRFTTRCSAMVAGDPGVTLIEYEESSVNDAVERVVATIAALGE